MFDAEGASEAVHMAILAHENKLLAMAPVTEELGEWWGEGEA